MQLFYRRSFGTQLDSQTGDLAQRVHARISSARTINVYFSTQEVLSCVDNFSLNGTAVRLFLPPAIARSLVFDIHSPCMNLHNYETVSAYSQFLYSVYRTKITPGQTARAQ